MIIPNITFNSVLQPIKNIEERNKAFDELTDEGKRQEIAWDALQLVINEKVGAALRVYWSSALSCITAENSKAFQQILINELPTDCYVCQRGLVMLSTIRLGDSILPNDDYREHGSSENLKGFSLFDMLIMEAEYEYSEFNHPYPNNSSEKLANICCNILVNGNFNPNDKTDYLT